MRIPDVLHQAEFQTYYTGQTVSALGSAMSTLAVTFAVLSIGGSVGELGLVLGMGAVPALLLMLLGGVAGDRWERRRILLTCDLTLAVNQGVLALAVIAGSAEIWHFVAAQLVSGAARAFSGPASIGFLPTLVVDDLIQEANSLLRIARNIAAVGGPPIAAMLVAVASPGWALLADSASFAISAALLARLPTSVGAVRAGATVLGDVKEGWREFISRRWVWQMVLSFSTYQATVLPAVYVLGPLLAERQFAGASTWAMVMAARAVGSILVGLLLLRWRPRRPLVASTAVILLDIPFLLAMATQLPLALVVVTAALSSAGVVAADTFWESTLQEKVPSEVISRVSSYDWFGSIAINPFGFILIGFAAATFGVGPVLVAVIACQVVVRGALLASPAIRAVKRDAGSREKS